MAGMTIRDLYNWAESTGCLDREMITIHSYDFAEDPGLQTWNKISGRDMYIEWADEATAAKYWRYEHDEEESKENKDDGEATDGLPAADDCGE